MSEPWHEVAAQQARAEIEAGGIAGRLLDLLLTYDTAMLALAAFLGMLLTVIIVEALKMADDALELWWLDGPRVAEKIRLNAFVVGALGTWAMAGKLTSAAMPTVVCLVVGIIAGWRAPWLNNLMDRRWPSWSERMRGRNPAALRAACEFPPPVAPTLEPPASLPPDDPGVKPKPKVIRLPKRRRK